MKFKATLVALFVCSGTGALCRFVSFSGVRSRRWCRRRGGQAVEEAWAGGSSTSTGMSGSIGKGNAGAPGSGGAGSGLRGYSSMGFQSAGGSPQGGTDTNQSAGARAVPQPGTPINPGSEGANGNTTGGPGTSH
jgi:hypothetical protein